MGVRACGDALSACFIGPWQRRVARSAGHVTVPWEQLPPPALATSAAAWALAHAAGHDEQLAARVCIAGALPALVACLSPSSASKDFTSKRLAASALGDISGHSTALAAQVVEAGGVAACAGLLRAPLCNDARLKRQLLCTLMHVAKAGPELAQSVVDAGAVPDLAR